MTLAQEIFQEKPNKASKDALALVEALVGAVDDWTSKMTFHSMTCILQEGLQVSAASPLRQKTMIHPTRWQLMTQVMARIWLNKTRTGVTFSAQPNVEIRMLLYNTAKDPHKVGRWFGRRSRS